MQKMVREICIQVREKLRESQATFLTFLMGTLILASAEFHKS